MISASPTTTKKQKGINRDEFLSNVSNTMNATMMRDGGWRLCQKVMTTRERYYLVICHTGLLSNINSIINILLETLTNLVKCQKKG